MPSSKRRFKLGAHWIGSARLGAVQSAEVKLKGTNGRPRTTSARLGTDPFGTYRNNSGILDRAKRSEDPKRAEGQ
jgi:hypothetical protein